LAAHGYDRRGAHIFDRRFVPGIGVVVEELQHHSNQLAFCNSGRDAEQVIVEGIHYTDDVAGPSERHELVFARYATQLCGHHLGVIKG